MISYKGDLDHWVDRLVSDARVEEIAEVEASHGTTILTAARDCITKSQEKWAICWDETLLCLVGVIPYSTLSDTAVPWMLSTNAIIKHPKPLVRYSRILTREWLKEWRTLENYIDARYTQSLNWARHVGFTVHPAMPYGVQGLPFHKITMERK